MAVFARVGCTRLDNIITSSSQDGSIQSDVPVNPTCPNARVENRVPDDEGADGVSHPNAQDEVSDSRWVNRFARAALKKPSRPWTA